MQNGEISGVAYQQGTRAGYEIRQYLLAKWSRCAYCGATEEFGRPTIQAQARQPLKDAAAVNSTRWALYQRLSATDLPVEGDTGGRTKFNRARPVAEATGYGYEGHLRGLHEPAQAGFAPKRRGL